MCIIQWLKNLFQTKPKQNYLINSSNSSQNQSYNNLSNYSRNSDGHVSWDKIDSVDAYEWRDQRNKK